MFLFVKISVLIWVEMTFQVTEMSDQRLCWTIFLKSRTSMFVDSILLHSYFTCPLAGSQEDAEETEEDEDTETEEQGDETPDEKEEEVKVNKKLEVW